MNENQDPPEIESLLPTHPVPPSPLTSISNPQSNARKLSLSSRKSLKIPLFVSPSNSNSDYVNYNNNEDSKNLNTASVLNNSSFMNNASHITNILFLRRSTPKKILFIFLNILTF